jgi:hypothetical protein
VNAHDRHDFAVRGPQTGADGVEQCGLAGAGDTREQVRAHRPSRERANNSITDGRAREDRPARFGTAPPGVA